MPRKLLILTDAHPYHITARSNNKDWFSIPMDQCMALFLEIIGKTKDRYEFEFHTFVLMSNHFHMIISTPKMNLDKGMRYLMTETSRAIARASGRINKMYGQRYHWTLIKTPSQYAHAYRYNFQNPLRAGICKTVSEYPWSSLKFPKHFNTNPGFSEYLPDSQKELEDWMNVLADEAFNDLIRRALRRFEFQFPKDPITKRSSDHSDKL